MTEQVTEYICPACGRPLADGERDAEFELSARREGSFRDLAGDDSRSGDGR